MTQGMALAVVGAKQSFCIKAHENLMMREGMHAALKSGPNASHVGWPAWSAAVCVLATKVTRER